MTQAVHTLVYSGFGLWRPVCHPGFPVFATEKLSGDNRLYGLQTAFHKENLQGKKPQRMLLFPAAGMIFLVQVFWKLSLSAFVIIFMDQLKRKHVSVFCSLLQKESVPYALEDVRDLMRNCLPCLGKLLARFLFSAAPSCTLQF